MSKITKSQAIFRFFGHIFVGGVLMQILSNFSERLEELIFESGITQNQLALALKISRGNLCEWITGKHSVTLSNALKLANFFNCSLEFLAGRVETKLSYTPRPCPSFYERLLQVMREQGKSRYRIVRDTKFSDGNFYSWKKGGDPFLQSVIELAVYFGLTLDAFIGRE